MNSFSVVPQMHPSSSSSSSSAPSESGRNYATRRGRMNPNVVMKSQQNPRVAEEAANNEMRSANQPPITYTFDTNVMEEMVRLKQEVVDREEVIFSRDSEINLLRELEQTARNNVQRLEEDLKYTNKKYSVKTIQMRINENRHAEQINKMKLILINKEKTIQGMQKQVELSAEKDSTIQAQKLEIDYWKTMFDNVTKGYRYHDGMFFQQNQHSAMHTGTLTSTGTGMASSWTSETQLINHTAAMQAPHLNRHHPIYPPPLGMPRFMYNGQHRGGGEEAGNNGVETNGSGIQNLNECIMPTGAERVASTSYEQRSTQPQQ